MQFNPIPVLTEQAQQRFWAQTNRDETGCLNRTSGLTPYGYSRFRTAGVELYAHRIAYTLIHGAIPAGMVIDHLCRNRACVEPAHLEAVSQQENVHRGDLLFGVCARGHSISGANAKYVAGKTPRCKQCHRDYSREWARKNTSKSQKLLFKPATTTTRQ